MRGTWGTIILLFLDKFQSILAGIHVHSYTHCRNVPDDEVCHEILKSAIEMPVARRPPHPAPADPPSRACLFRGENMQMNLGSFSFVLTLSLSLRSAFSSEFSSHSFESTPWRSIAQSQRWMCECVSQLRAQMINWHCLLIGVCIYMFSWYLSASAKFSNTLTCADIQRSLKCFCGTITSSQCQKKYPASGCVRKPSYRGSTS